MLYRIPGSVSRRLGRAAAQVFTNTTDASSSTSGGAFTISGGLAVAKAFFVGLAATVGGVLKTTDTTQSTSTTTGALQSAGGLGVAKDVNAGGSLISRVDPTAGFVLDGANTPTKTIVNTGALVLASNFSGLVMINNVTDNEVALYFVNYANVFLLAQGAAGFSGTPGAVAGKLSMGYSGGTYLVYNSSGANKDVQVTIIRARAGA